MELLKYIRQRLIQVLIIFFVIMTVLFCFSVWHLETRYRE